MNVRSGLRLWAIGLVIFAAAGLVGLALLRRDQGPATLGFSARAVPGESREISWPAETIVLEVDEVLAGGPAANTGLQIGDRLLSINGARVDDECALSAQLETLTIGHKTTISFERRGETETIEVEPVAKQQLFAQLCTAGDPRACREQASLVELQEGARLLEGACEKGDPIACRKLGDRLSEGASADPERARTLYDRACDEGDAAGCTRIGFLYSTGSPSAGVVRDDVRATLLFEAACRAGDAAGCYNVGLMYANTRGTVRNDARALLGYVRACAGGFATACTNLGYLYENGLGLIASRTRAAKLYERACQGFACQPADPIGCTNLGIYAREGWGGVPRDLARAAELFARACAADQASGCTNLGRLEEDGQGIARDVAAAVEHYRRGCTLGSAGGCRNLAGAITEGLAPAQEADEVEQLLGRACELGDADACGPAAATRSSAPQP